METIRTCFKKRTGPRLQPGVARRAPNSVGVIFGAADRGFSRVLLDKPLY